ncbi:MAG: hypothetical protein GY953_55420, partial [bacterium]|nr:hypothetical protein [bacterium]
MKLPLGAEGAFYVGGAMDGKGFVAEWDGGQPEWVVLDDALYITGIALGRDGDLWAAGYTVNEAYLARLRDSDLSVIERTTFGGSSKDAAWGIALTASGDPVIAGTTNSPDLPIAPDVLQPRHAGKDDAFLAVFTGGAFRATYLGDGDPNSVGFDGDIIAVDAEGNIWLAGITGPDDARANGFLASVSADLTTLR